MSSPRRARQAFRPTTPPSKRKNDQLKDEQDYLPPSGARNNTAGNEFDDDGRYDYHTPLNSETGTSFSPSKARAQAKATYQTRALERWLANLVQKSDAAATASTSTSTSTSTNTTSSGAQVHPLITRWEREYATLQHQAPPNYPGVADDILKALQDLMYANQAADSHRMLLHEARREELAYLQANEDELMNITTSESHNTQSGPALLTELENALSPEAQASLTSLAETAVLLGTIPDASSSPIATEEPPPPPTTKTTTSTSTTLTEELATQLIKQTSQILDLRSTITTLQTLTTTLRTQQHSAQTELTTLDQIRSKSQASTENLQAQTSQRQREMKQIALKIQEYNDRVATLMRSRPGVVRSRGGNHDGSNNDNNDDEGNAVLDEDVLAIQNRVNQRAEVVKSLEERVRVFKGLPADLDASREEVKRARMELGGLKKKRGELFESMVS